MPSLDAFATDKLATLEARHLRRHLRSFHRTSDTTVETAAGHELLSLSTNDVLGLSRHPDVIAAALDATARYGTGAGASRLVTGNAPPLDTLEAALAHWKRTEGALVFASGYLASLGIIPALVGPGDLVVLDALSHACLFAGARLSGAEVETFAHNDPASLACRLVVHRPRARNCLILTETVFSMDGDRAPLVELGTLAASHDAWFATDDAHGLGLLADGRGGVHACGAEHLVPLQLGTLSKALGAHGGYLCASAAIVALMQSRARSFVYATGLPPAAAAAAVAALAVIASDPELTRRPFANATRFCAAALLPPPESHIVPIHAGTAERALAWQSRLESHGVLAIAIRPPTVPDGTARLRLAFPAALTGAETDRIAALVRDLRSAA